MNEERLANDRHDINHQIQPISTMFSNKHFENLKLNKLFEKQKHKNNTICSNVVAAEASSNGA